MARMIPPLIDSELSPPGEVIMFELLARDAPESWTVLHSLDLPQHVRQVEGELDFLILIPGGAVICLEVKSHLKVTRDNSGMWLLGNDAPTARSPFKQANDAMHSIRNRLGQHQDLAAVPFVSAVAFPRCPFEVPGVEWEDYQVLDENDLQARGAVAVLEKIATSHREKLAKVPTAAWFNASSGQPTGEQCDQIVRITRPTFERSRTPKARRAESQGEIRRYTEEQFGALDALEDNPRVVFTGSAGTGKTFIALEGARRAVARDHRVLLCCYNRLLGTWIGQEAAPLGSSATAGTLHSTMLAIAGIPVPDNASNTFWSEDLPTATIDALLDGHPAAGSYDTIVIDEAQDICIPQYLDVLDLLAAGGLSGGQVLAFGDFEHQAIYTGADGRPLLADRMQATAFRLKDNCRNRPRIGSLATAACGTNAYRHYLRTDDGIDITIRPYPDPGTQTERVTALIDAFRADGYQLGDIAILSPLAHGAAHTTLGSPHSAWLADATPTPGAKIRTGTIHAFKGLEASAVIVTDIDDLTATHARSLLYVAATRATDRLAICVAAEAVPQLQQLIIGGTT